MYFDKRFAMVIHFLSFNNLSKDGSDHKAVRPTMVSASSGDRRKTSLTCDGWVHGLELKRRWLHFAPIRILSMYPLDEAQQ